MIVEDFLVINERGLYCRYGDFYIDPNEPSAYAVVSHAHGDHAVRGNDIVYCTPATSAIMKHRYQKNAGKTFITYNWSESFDLNGVLISFIPAGHILGSAQVLMVYKDVRYLYTGDYKLQLDSTCEKIEFVKADVLISESTFADPEVLHPPASDEIKKLNSFSHNVLLGAYSLGKAQRLIHLLSEYCPQRHIVPPLTFNSYIRAKNVVRAFASGWINLQSTNDLKILISDHVDWNDILTMVKQVDPTEIWTLHGDGKHLKSYFKDQLTVKLLNYAG